MMSEPIKPMPHKTNDRHSWKKPKALIVVRIENKPINGLPIKQTVKIQPTNKTSPQQNISQNMKNRFKKRIPVI